MACSWKNVSFSKQFCQTCLVLAHIPSAVEALDRLDKILKNIQLGVILPWDDDDPNNKSSSLLIFIIPFSLVLVSAGHGENFFDLWTKMTMADLWSCFVSGEKSEQLKDRPAEDSLTLLFM